MKKLILFCLLLIGCAKYTYSNEKTTQGSVSDMEHRPPYTTTESYISYVGKHAEPVVQYRQNYHSEVFTISFRSESGYLFKSNDKDLFYRLSMGQKVVLHYVTILKDGESYGVELRGVELPEPKVE